MLKMEGNVFFETGGITLKTEFKDLYNVFCATVESDMSILSMYVVKDMFSIEATTLLFAECIIEDIDTIEKLKLQKFAHRYTDGIIRGICEQVIEFIYLNKNRNLLTQYYGINKTESELNDIANKTDLFMAIRHLIGDKRYSNGRNILNMAENIGEKEGKNGDFSLYEAYEYISTRYHNSYLEHLGDIVDDVEGDEEDDELDYLILIVILHKFIEAYENIVSVHR